MKQLFITLFITTLATAGFAQQTVFNDANAQKRDVQSFHAINISNAIDLFLSQGNEDAVAVSAGDVKYRDNIRTEVKDGVLRIWYVHTGRGWSVGNKKLRAYVSVKNIDKLEASGSSDVLVSGTLSSTSFDLKLTGASDFKGTLAAGSLKVNISGASDVTIRGTANVLSVDASGASDFKGYDLVTQTCDIKASGASDVKITCDKELDANASGASDVHIKGNGVIRNMHSSGASSVKKV